MYIYILYGTPNSAGSCSVVNVMIIMHSKDWQFFNLLGKDHPEFDNNSNRAHMKYIHYVNYLIATDILYGILPLLEITVSHWPFSDQFQHLANQDPFWSAKFTEHFK